MKKATPKSSPNHASQHDHTKLGVLSHIESRFIPRIPSQARLLLEILSDGLEHSTQELTLKLGSDPRSPRQTLTNGYWHIINVLVSQSRANISLIQDTCQGFMVTILGLEQKQKSPTSNVQKKAQRVGM